MFFQKACTILVGFRKLLADLGAVKRSLGLSEYSTLHKSLIESPVCLSTEYPCGRSPLTSSPTFQATITMVALFVPLFFFLLSTVSFSPQDVAKFFALQLQPDEAHILSGPAESDIIRVCMCK